MSKLLEQISTHSLKKGFNPVVGDMYQRTEQWLSWYRGSVNDWHFFRRNVNGKMKQFEIKTLSMGKKVAEDWAGLLYNNSCSITVDNEVAQLMLDDVFAMNNFQVDFGNLVEKSFALGNGFVISYISNGQTKIDFITLRNALVTEYDNTRVTGLVTINKFSTLDKQYVTHLTYHYTRDNMYVVEHEVFLSKTKESLGEFKPENILMVFNEEEATSMRFITQDGKERFMVMYDTPRPFFAHIKPNITNNFDIESPLGISVFANSLDLLKSIDTKFNATEREVVQNKTRIMVNSEWLKVKAEDNEQTGEMQFIKYYDESDDAIIGIPTMDSEKLMEFYQGTFRLEPLEMSLQKDVIRLGNAVGLGKSYYNYQNGDVYQNETTVIHSNSQTWKNKQKHEMILREALEDIAYSVVFLESLNRGINMDVDSLEFNIQFDDSIIEDDSAKLEKMMALANQGFIPKWMVVQYEFNLSEEEAKELTGELTLDNLFEGEKLEPIEYTTVLED